MVVDQGATTTTVDVIGALDINTVDHLIAEVGAACGGGRMSIVNLRGLEFMDSSGVKALILLKRRCADDGGELRLVDLPPTIEATLRRMGLVEHLDL